MRWISFVSLATLAGVAGATVPMESALSDLRKQPSLALILEGEEQTGRKLTPFRVNTYFVDGAAPGPKLEQYVYRNEVLVRRIVADGNVLTDYDAKLNQFSVDRYDLDAGKLAGLLRRLKGTSNGFASAPLRLIGDVYLPSASTWQPWMSIVQPVWANNWESYIASDERYDFRLTPVDLLTFRMPEVRYEKANSARSVNWRMEVLPGFVPSAIPFQFVPPKGAKAVAAPSSSKVGGGG